MSQPESIDINRLVTSFMDLQERWEDNPGAFDWSLLEALAREGAGAYNEGAGPSFHSLVLDGVPHSELHERFLRASLAAGFDPFRLSRAGEAERTTRPVLDHAALAGAASANPASARMHMQLLEAARARFAPQVEQAQRGDQGMRSTLYAIFTSCAESIPPELLAGIVPELVRPHGTGVSYASLPPEEGYLALPESIVDSRAPHG
jgi:hypothetical protein